MRLEVFEEEVINALRLLLDNNVERDLAKRSQVSRGYINALKNKKKPPRALSVETLLKLFPNATINLHGDSVIADNSGINNGVMGVNNGTVNSAGHESVEAFRSKAIAAMIDLDIPADALREVLKTLKDLPLGTKP